jgi:hypothetical protein
MQVLEASCVMQAGSEVPLANTMSFESLGRMDKAEKLLLC